MGKYCEGILADSAINIIMKLNELISKKSSNTEPCYDCKGKGHSIREIEKTNPNGKKYLDRTVVGCPRCKMKGRLPKKFDPKMAAANDLKESVYTIEDIIEWKRYTSSGEETITLYHGTCPENGEALCKNGWVPRQSSMGGNMGQPRYLYLSTGKEDALWYAEEKGCNTLVEVKDVPLRYLKVDPEDGTSDTLEEELHKKSGLPGKVVLTRPLPAEHFRIINAKIAGTKDSNNINENQNTSITDTPEFKSWFKGSKVVDSVGKPLVVYHGTKRNFNTFNTDKKELGSHFGTQSHANGAINRGTRYIGSNIIPCYLSIKNPLRLRDKGRFHPRDLKKELVELSILSNDEMNKIAQLPYKEGNAILKRVLISKGYDGIVYLNRSEDVTVDVDKANSLSDDEYLSFQPHATDSWIAFNPNQIKSAIGNNGKFSKDSNVVTEAPDFGYSTYHDREKELSKLRVVKWEDTYRASAKEVIIGFYDSKTNEVDGYRIMEDSVGYIQFIISGNTATVVEAKISNKWKGTGLGQLLYDKAIQYAKELGLRYFQSDITRSENALSAWKRLARRYPVKTISHGGVTYSEIDLRKVK